MALAPRSGGYVFMMQPGSWGSWVFSINSTTPNGTGSDVAFGTGGFQEARGTGGPTKGGGGFYVSHRPELLDAACEFYHDLDAGVLYLAVDSSDGNPSPPGLLYVPQVEQLFKLEGTVGRFVSNCVAAVCTLSHHHAHAGRHVFSRFCRMDANWMYCREFMSQAQWQRPLSGSRSLG